MEVRGEATGEEERRRRRIVHEGEEDEVRGREGWRRAKEGRQKGEEGNLHHSAIVNPSTALAT